MTHRGAERANEQPRRTAFALGMVAAAGAVGCAMVTAELPPAGRNAPAQCVVRASQYAFTTDFELDRRDPLVLDLVALGAVVQEKLQLPDPTDVVRVVVFASRQEYHEYLAANFPDLPDRRAFFVKQGADLLVLACRGERLT
ncbi:MAG: hypothetical protein ACRC1K_12615, partial [Planctomycetia bacterium]